MNQAMIEIIIVWAIVLVCAIYTGRRFFKQFKRAADDNSSLDCGGGCSCCSISDCSDKESTGNLEK
jgi:hypothetical protein